MQTDYLEQERAPARPRVLTGPGPAPRRALTRRTVRVYRLTNEAGELLQEFREEDYPKGPNGALYAAARKAAALQREGQTVILTGPAGFDTRRYAPEYLPTDGKPRRYTWRVPCSVAGCPNWVHPVKRTEAALCREHFAASPELVKQAETMRAARRRKP